MRIGYLYKTLRPPRPEHRQALRIRWLPELCTHGGAWSAETAPELDGSETDGWPLASRDHDTVPSPRDVDIEHSPIGVFVPGTAAFWPAAAPLANTMTSSMSGRNGAPPDLGISLSAPRALTRSSTVTYVVNMEMPTDADKPSFERLIDATMLTEIELNSILRHIGDEQEPRLRALIRALLVQSGSLGIDDTYLVQANQSMASGTDMRAQGEYWRRLLEMTSNPKLFGHDRG